MKTLIVSAIAFAALATSVLAGGSHSPAPAPKQNDIYTSVYAKMERDTNGKVSVYDTKLNQSEVRQSVLGTSGTNDVLGVNQDNLKLVQKTEAVTSGNVNGTLDLNKSTLNGGVSASAEQQGSFGVFGVGADGDTTISLNTKSIASQTVVGAVAGGTTKLVNSDNN